MAPLTSAVTFFFNLLLINFWLATSEKHAFVLFDHLRNANGVMANVGKLVFEV